MAFALLIVFFMADSQLKIVIAGQTIFEGAKPLKSKAFCTLTSMCSGEGGIFHFLFSWLRTSLWSQMCQKSCRRLKLEKITLISLENGSALPIIWLIFGLSCTHMPTLKCRACFNNVSFTRLAFHHIVIRNMPARHTCHTQSSSAIKRGKQIICWSRPGLYDLSTFKVFRSASQNGNSEM